MVQEENCIDLVAGEHEALVEVVYLFSEHLFEAEGHHAGHTLIESRQVAQGSIDVAHFDPPLDRRLVKLDYHFVAVSLQISFHCTVDISLWWVGDLCDVEQEFKLYKNRSISNNTCVVLDLFCTHLTFSHHFLRAVPF